MAKKKSRKKKNRIVLSGPAFYITLIFLIIGATCLGYTTVYFLEGGTIEGLKMLHYMARQKEAYVNNQELREKFAPVVLPCDGRQMCVIEKIAYALINDTEYVGQYPGVVAKISSTLKIGGGDCEDLSVLAVSVLMQYGIEAYVACSDLHRHCVAYAYPENSDSYYILDLANDNLQVLSKKFDFWDFYGN